MERNKDIKDAIEYELLNSVRMPGRYIGGEVNQIVKSPDSVETRMAMCFPDTYEIGMSNTALGILYDIVNKLGWAAAERVFTPWTDAEQVMREKEIPLFSLENKSAVSDFDVVGFSTTTELCHTNVLNMLDLAGLEVRSSKRSANDPLVIAGGQVANCCEPLAEFIDVFIIGEGEEALVELLEVVREAKKNNTPREELLTCIAKSFDWAYVPSLYEFEYDGDKISAFKSKSAGLPVRFNNAVVSDFENAPVPEKPIVPFTEAVHERVSVEIMRGCPGRCRFCQASFSRRPLRYRSVDKIVEIAKTNYLSTGFDTVSLLSLSTADYPWLEELIDKLREYFDDKKVGISLPSLKVDKQLELVPKMASSVRKSGLTIAVEAASESLRKMINKPITNENLFKAIKEAYRVGFHRVKLYFMVGFPGETEQDIRDIVDLAYEVASIHKEISGRPANVNAAVSWLVPKPHTPFQWVGQKSQQYFEDAKTIILQRKRELNIRCVKFNFHELDRSQIEAAVGRGDRRICDAIEAVWRKGARFDLWNEHFDYQLWIDTFAEHGIDLAELAEKSYDAADILPWQHLGGLDTEYYLRHYNKACE
ncbi:MAG: TIGR03960 family B12-binding radical SAM protein [Sedimentisphaeraceae bacterium JB056]